MSDGANKAALAVAPLFQDNRPQGRLLRLLHGADMATFHTMMLAELQRRLDAAAAEYQ